MARRLTSDDYKNTIIHLGLKTKSSLNFGSPNIMVRCPYHRDRNPSLSINIKTGAFQCFQCHRQGHLSELVLDLRKKTIYELLDINTWEDQVDAYAKLGKEEDYDPPVEKIENDISVSYRGALIPFDSSPEAQEYAHKRYLPLDEVKRIGASFAKEIYFGDFYYHDRFIIPVYTQLDDGTAKLVNLECRDTTFSQDRKCIYPQNTVKPLFEWYRMNPDNPVYLFEGLIKMLVARSDKFFANSSTIFGSYISPYQLGLIKKANIKHIICVPDNDEPGKIFIKQCKKLADISVDVMRISDPNIKDTDEIPSKSGQTIEQFRKSGGFVMDYNLD